MQNHLHYFVPALLNCVISRRMCTKPESDNHWILRFYASKTLSHICTVFQFIYPTLTVKNFLLVIKFRCVL